MISRIYAVKDLKADVFTPPFLQVTKGVAIRGFEEYANDENHHFFKHPLDYVLYELGTYDDSNAKVEMYDIPTPVGTAQDFKK